MFLKNPGKPTTLKKVIYLSASTVLGFLLSVIAHVLIELNFLLWGMRSGNLIAFSGNCLLPPLLRTSLWVFGTIGGFLVGHFWWKKVYITRIWAKKRTKSRR